MSNASADPFHSYRTLWLRRVGALSVSLAAWSLFGILWAARFLLTREGSHDWNAFVEAGDHVIPFYWGWAVLTPAVVSFARFTLRNPGLPDRRAWSILAGATPLFVVAHGVLYLALLRLLGIRPGAAASQSLGAFAMRHGGSDVATYLALIGALILIDQTRRSHEREITAAHLAARLSQTDLELLRWQLQPHFVFNALNTVSTLVLTGQAAEANAAITHIARHLRGALSQRADSLIPLGEDIKALNEYVVIETLRFGGTLRVEINADDDARAATVPGPLLQPLVENAIRHSSATRETGGPIVVTAAVRGDRLRITVTDPGALRNELAAGRGDGFGLRYVRDRLRLFYGDRATFTIAVSPAGSLATVDLPLLK